MRYTMTEAAHVLECDRKTLLLWMQRAEIAPELGTEYVDGKRDKRKWLTLEQIERIRQARVEAAGETFTSFAGLVQRLTERMETIERRLDALEARRAALPSILPPLAPQSVQRVYSPRPRADDTLPQGWIAVSTWARKHGLNGQERTMVRLWQDGRFPAPQVSEEGWRHNGATVKSAYTEEQHREASREAAARWPRSFVPCPLCATDRAAAAPEPDIDAAE